MRALDPDRLVSLDSGLWVLDACQPVAAVIDPITGELRRIVSWASTVPPVSFDSEWVAEHGVDDGPEVTSSGTYEDIGWYDPPGEDHLEHRPVVAQGLRWYAGWPHDDEPEPPIDGGVRFAALMISGDDSEPMRSHRLDLGQDGRTCARSLRIGGYDDDRPVFEIDPGPGSIRAIEPVAGGVAVSVLRPGPAGRERAEVLHVDPTGVVRVLMDAAPSIDGLGWPVGPMPADATARLTAARELCADWMDGTGRLPSEAMREIHARVVGEWPHAAVVVEFSHPARDGARLRMRVLLFDELGRPWDLDDVWFDLWEDLETAHLPSIGDAVDGVLEIGPDRR